MTARPFVPQHRLSVDRVEEASGSTQSRCLAQWSGRCSCSELVRFYGTPSSPSLAQRQSDEIHAAHARHVGGEK